MGKYIIIQGHVHIEKGNISNCTCNIDILQLLPDNVNIYPSKVRPTLAYRNMFFHSYSSSTMIAITLFTVAMFSNLCDKS